MKEIYVGDNKIYIEYRNGKEIAVCPNCGSVLNYRHLQTIMPAAETGFFYCSVKCAKEDVEKEYIIIEEEEE